jgi:hypothetical protein
VKGRKLQGERKTGKRERREKVKERNREKTKIYQNIDGYYVSVVKVLVSINMM